MIRREGARNAVNGREQARVKIPERQKLRESEQPPCNHRRGTQAGPGHFTSLLTANQKVRVGNGGRATGSSPATSTASIEAAPVGGRSEARFMALRSAAR